MFSKVGISWLRQITLPKTERFILDSELDLMAQLNLQIKDADRLLKEVGQRDDRIRQLMTIPGLGKTLAMLVLAEMADYFGPNRSMIDFAEYSFLFFRFP